LIVSYGAPVLCLVLRDTAVKRRTDTGKKLAMCTQRQRLEWHICEPRKTKD